MNDAAASTPALIRRLHDHKRHALQQFLTALRDIPAHHLTQPFDMGRGSLIATAAHIATADFVWIAILERDDDAPRYTDADFPTLPEIEQLVANAQDRWTQYLDRINEHDLRDTITEYSPTLGRERTLSALDICLHVPNHQTHTIAQGRNMLRQLGHTTEHTHIPRTDLIHWAIDRPL